MTFQNMGDRIPIHLVAIETDFDGNRKFVKAKNPYTHRIWGAKYSRFFFKLRKTLFDKPNCNLNCPPGRDFFCCVNFGCRFHHGFFEYDEILLFSEEEREKILSHWNDETGFLGKDGCVLPRELRSYVCLAFDCRHGRAKD